MNPSPKAYKHLFQPANESVRAVHTLYCSSNLIRCPHPCAHKSEKHTGNRIAATSQPPSFPLCHELGVVLEHSVVHSVLHPRQQAGQHLKAATHTHVRRLKSPRQQAGQDLKAAIHTRVRRLESPRQQAGQHLKAATHAQRAVSAELAKFNLAEPQNE